jgi:FMN phosphatase YigB (HAD superfamily)
MDVLATADTRSVYDDLLSLAAGHALTDHAADRIRVLTPLLDREVAESRLDDVVAARDAWAGLADDDRGAVVAAFDPDVTRRDGARQAVRDAAASGPVGLLSNCAVPELVPKTLIRAGLRGEFDAVTTSIGCGWRKPHPKAFEAAAKALGVAPASLVHVGDDPETDGGVEAVGGRFVDVTETPLDALAAQLEAEL